jgi:hypothetical protein
MSPTLVQAAPGDSDFSAQIGSFAANAGGQSAYAVRYSKNQHQYSLFSNQYLQAGGVPVTGVTYNYILPICTKDCFWRFWSSIGAGGSNVGPIIDISWTGLVPLIPIWLPRGHFKYVPNLRIDFTTQLMFLRTRVVAWSYPLWAGISVPF